jgi:hypothetical protein
VTWTYSPIKRL